MYKFSCVTHIAGYYIVSSQVSYHHIIIIIIIIIVIVVVTVLVTSYCVSSCSAISHLPKLTPNSKPWS